MYVTTHVRYLNIYLSFRQNSLSDAAEGRIVACITKVNQANGLTVFPVHHFIFKIVQEKPELLAQAIGNIEYHQGRVFL
jgi:hypothetical protein